MIMALNCQKAMQIGVIDLNLLTFLYKLQQIKVQIQSTDWLFIKDNILIAIAC